MATYRQLKAQIAEIEEMMALARAAEIADVLADIRARVEEFGLSEEDIFGVRAGTKRSRPAGYRIPPKYRDPRTGATWSGRGRAPRWIAEVKNRARFLIPA